MPIEAEIHCPKCGKKEKVGPGVFTFKCKDGEWTVDIQPKRKADQPAPRS